MSKMNAGLKMNCLKPRHYQKLHCGLTELQIAQLNSSSVWGAQRLEVCAAPSTKGPFIPG